MRTLPLRWAFTFTHCGQQLLVAAITADTEESQPPYAGNNQRERDPRRAERRPAGAQRGNRATPLQLVPLHPKTHQPKRAYLQRAQARASNPARDCGSLAQVDNHATADHAQRNTHPAPASTKGQL